MLINVRNAAMDKSNGSDQLVEFAFLWREIINKYMNKLIIAGW